MTDIHSCSYYCDRPKCIKAQRDELRERLAQPEPKPVAWTLLLTGEHSGMVGKAGEKFVGAPDYYQRVNVYTALPQRTWVGLTDEEIDGCDWGQSERDYARTIEAKLKQKNGYAEEKNT